jgi:hypothetical protein
VVVVALVVVVTAAVVVVTAVVVVVVGVVVDASATHWAEELPPMPVKYLPFEQLWHVVLDGAAAAVE